jgi:hypothetical protein
VADDDGEPRGRDDDERDDLDDYDDDDDEYYDDEDDYDEREVDDRAADKRRRDTWLVAGAAAIIVIAVLVIVLKGDSKKNTDTGTGTSTDSGQVADGGGTTAANASPVWPEEARHPPKGLEGDGQPTAGAAPLPAGVYFWYSDFSGWYIKIIHGQGVGALKIGVGDTTPQGSPVALKDAAPTGVTSTQVSPSKISLDVADSTDPQLVHLDVNGLVGSLTWTFDGVPTNLVTMGVSPNPVGVTPFTVAKQPPK